MTLRIVVDENIPLVHEFFSTLGEIIAVPPRDIEPTHLRKAELLIVRSVAPITETLLQGSAVKFVGTCTAGTDHLATAYLDAQEIRWTGAPGCNANAVVEYVFSVMSRLQLQWQRSRIGIIGCGHVGGLLQRRLKNFGVECRCFDPFLDAAENIDLCSLDEVLQSDIVCVHAPFTTTGPYPTYHLLGEEQLQQLRPGTVLINAGRGPVIDGEALLNTLEKRHDLTLVLDVWEHEPRIARALFARVKLGTPHIAGHSYDGKIKGTVMIYRAACEFLNVTPTLSLADFDQQPLQDHEIAANNAEEVLRQAVLKAYDVGDDYQRFEQQLRDSNDVGTVFDQYRKNYPIRREFHKHRITLTQRNNETADQLKLLGFQVFE